MPNLPDTQSDRVSVELTERYGRAFAKALAVFVKELSCGDPQAGQFSQVSGNGLPESVLEVARAEIARNEKLWEAGKLEPVEFTSRSPAVGLVNRLKTVIHERRISQKELARRMGVSPSFISRVLRDPERSRLATLKRIARALDIPLSSVV